MKKILQKALMTTFLMSLGAVTATAEDYIEATMAISDGTSALFNNATIGGLGYIDIYWENTTLAMSNTGMAQRNYIENFEDKFSITVAGVEMVNSSNFPNESTKAGFYLTTLYETNEQFGGTDEIKTTLLRIQLPDAAYFNWKGQWVLTVQPGTVETTDGKINPQIKIVFYSMSLYGETNLTYPAIWDPKPSGDENRIPNSIEWGTFKPTLTWEGVTSLDINENSATVPFLQKQTDGVNGEQIPIMNLMSVEGTNIVFDFTKLPGGTYSLDLPEASIFINHDYMSWVTQLNFTINPAPQPVLPIVSWSPTNTSSLESISEVIVSWMNAPLTQGSGNGLVTATFNGQPLQTQPTVKLQNVNAEAGGQGIDNVISINFAGIEFDESGELVITIPDGYVNVEVEDVANESTTILPNEKVVITYNIVVPDPLVLDDPAVDPAGGEVESLSSVTFTWTAALSLELNSKCEEDVVVTVNGELYKNFKVSNKSNTLTVTLSGEFENRDAIEINVPEGYLIGKDTMDVRITNGPASVSYTYVVKPVTSGIESMDSENGINTIYNLHGIRVNNENIPAGIYIINGKKVTVK